jgi:hypothetical protein
MPINPTLSRPGLVNAGGGAVDALFLKQFSGEVMTAFEQANIMLPLTTVRTITNGKSTSFPTIGIATAKYHSPGTDLLDSTSAGGNYGDGTASGNTSYGTQFKHNEVILTVDDLLVSSTFIPEIEELENHYDIRATYSSEMGKALAYTTDKQLLRVALRASRTTVAVNGDYLANGTWKNGNTLVTHADLGSAVAADTYVPAFIKAMYACAQRFDELSLPAMERTCVISPENFYKLYTAGVSGSGPISIHRDFGNEGNGSIAQPKEYLYIGGIKVVKSIHLPTTDLTGDTRYRGNFSTSTGIVFCKPAVGTVKLMDLSMQSEYRIDRQGTLMVARYAMGHGVLRPEAAIELSTAATSNPA